MDVSCFSGAHTIYLNLIDTRGVDQTKFLFLSTVEVSTFAASGKNKWFS